VSSDNESGPWGVHVIMQRVVGDTMPTKKKLNRTNARGTCLWCGKKLGIARDVSLQPNRGDYGDNAFCGLRCGYSFGIASAMNEFRLPPYQYKAMRKKKRQE